MGLSGSRDSLCCTFYDHGNAPHSRLTGRVVSAFNEVETISARVGFPQKKKDEGIISLRKSARRISSGENPVIHLPTPEKNIIEAASPGKSDISPPCMNLELSRL